MKLELHFTIPPTPAIYARTDDDQAEQFDEDFDDLDDEEEIEDKEKEPDQPEDPDVDLSLLSIDGANST